MKHATGLLPGLPPLTPTQGSRAPHSHSSTPELEVVGLRGRGLLPSPVELEPKGPAHPSLGSLQAPPPLPPSPHPWVLTGRLPSKVSQTNWLWPSSLGPGSMPPSPRSPKLSSYANLQLQLRTLPWLGTRLCLLPRGWAATQLQQPYIWMRKSQPLTQ